jgi:hypothetical protein
MKEPQALLVALLIGVGVSGCGEICSNTPVAVTPSPNGKTKAVVFHRKCGATTGPNTQVSVLPAYSELPNIPGNALVLDADATLAVTWTSDASLSVSGLGAARASKQQEAVNEVSIVYGK